MSKEPSTSVKSPMVTSAIKKKVTCNCKRSRCLKLYCDCFRFEFYCDSSCNCFDCANNERFEEDRVAARRACLERNQDAFKPKVNKSGLRPELAGCRCKKSACLKKYCECFNAIIPCTVKCQCIDCRNIAALYNPTSTTRHPHLLAKLTPDIRLYEQQQLANMRYGFNSFTTSPDLTP